MDIWQLVRNDKELSLKAKGVFSIIALASEDITVKMLVENSKDGEASVRSALNELISAGYVSRFYHSDGKTGVHMRYGMNINGVRK